MPSFRRACKFFTKLREAARGVPTTTHCFQALCTFTTNAPVRPLAPTTATVGLMQRGIYEACTTETLAKHTIGLEESSTARARTRQARCD